MNNVIFIYAYSKRWKFHLFDIRAEHTNELNIRVLLKLHYPSLKFFVNYPASTLILFSRRRLLIIVGLCNLWCDLAAGDRMTSCDVLGAVYNVRSAETVDCNFCVYVRLWHDQFKSVRRRRIGPCVARKDLVATPCMCSPKSSRLAACFWCAVRLVPVFNVQLCDTPRTTQCKYD